MKNNNNYFKSPLFTKHHQFPQKKPVPSLHLEVNSLVCITAWIFIFQDLLETENLLDFPYKPAYFWVRQVLKTDVTATYTVSCSVSS